MYIYIYIYIYIYDRYAKFSFTNILSYLIFLLFNVLDISMFNHMA